MSGRHPERVGMGRPAVGTECLVEAGRAQGVADGSTATSPVSACATRDGRAGAHMQPVPAWSRWFRGTSGGLLPARTVLVHEALSKIIPRISRVLLLHLVSPRRLAAAGRFGAYLLRAPRCIRPPTPPATPVTRSRPCYATCGRPGSPCSRRPASPAAAAPPPPSWWWSHRAPTPSSDSATATPAPGRAGCACSRAGPQCGQKRCPAGPPLPRRPDPPARPRNDPRKDSPR